MGPAIALTHRDSLNILLPRKSEFLFANYEELPYWVSGHPITFSYIGWYLCVTIFFVSTSP